MLGKNKIENILKIIAIVIWTVGGFAALITLCVLAEEFEGFSFVIFLIILASSFISGILFYAFGENIALLQKISDKNDERRHKELLAALHKITVQSAGVKGHSDELPDL